MNSYKTVSNKIVRYRYATLLDLGFDEWLIQSKTGVSKDDVFRDQGRIGFSKYFRLGLFLHRNNIPFIDENIWHYSLEDSMYEFGALTGLAVNCPDVKTALETQMTYRAIIGESDYVSQFFYGDKVVIQYISEQESQSHIEFSSGSALANFIRIAHVLRYYLNEDELSLDVGFVGRPLFETTAYQSFFSGEVSFHRDLNYMAFDSSLLERTNPHFNRLLYPFLVEQVEQEFARCCNKHNYSSLVKSKLMSFEQTNALANADLAQVSEALNVSQYKLRRKLSAEGTSFIKLLTDVRKKQAQHYLMDRTLVIGEISDKLGFSSQGAFSRFFNQQYGMSPSDYRQRLSG